MVVVVHTQIPDFEMPDDADVQVAADAFRMLSDKNRIKILVALLQGESSVNCLAELIDASPSAVSQHLAKLRLAGLVNVRREGTYAYYAARTLTSSASWTRHFPTQIMLPIGWIQPPHTATAHERRRPADARSSVRAQAISATPRPVLVMVS